METLSVRLHHSQTGDSLAVARWSYSPLQGLRDAKLVIKDVVGEMLKRPRAAPPTPRP